MRLLDLNNERHKVLIALIALFILPISGVSTDIYVPSLPAVSHYFHIDKAFAQLTLTSFMIGVGVMQLFAGGLVDSYGRKKPFLLAMSFYLIATFCIPFITGIDQLLLLRFIQGVTIAVTVVSMRSIVPDLFRGSAYYKMMSYMTITWSIGPIIAPTIGGYLTHYYGWKSNFYFLSFYSFIALILVLFAMPETTRHQHDFSIKTLLKRYKHYLSNWQYFSGVVTNGLLYSMIVLFSVVGPFLIQVSLHYSPIVFGYSALSIGTAWFLGATSNRFLINMDHVLKTKCCLWTVFFIAILMLIESLIFPMTIYSIVIPLFFLALFAGIVFPLNFAKALAMFPETTGSANALFGSLIFVILSITTGLGASLKFENQLPLVISYIGLITICLMLFYYRKNEK